MRKEVGGCTSAGIPGYSKTLSQQLLPSSLSVKLAFESAHIIIVSRIPDIEKGPSVLVKVSPAAKTITASVATSVPSIEIEVVLSPALTVPMFFIVYEML